MSRSFQIISHFPDLRAVLIFPGHFPFSRRLQNHSDCLELYCLALPCISLSCILLSCIVLYCILLYWKNLYCIGTVSHASSGNFLREKKLLSGKFWVFVPLLKTTSTYSKWQMCLVSCLVFGFQEYFELSIRNLVYRLNEVFSFNDYWPCLNKVVFFSWNWPCLTKIPCLNKVRCLNRATLFKPCYLG